MASIEKRRDGRLRARWRKVPGEPPWAGHFAGRIDAERFRVEVQHKIQMGAHVPLDPGRITIRSYAEEWQRAAG